jgi:integrase/recombinase XerC
MRFMSDKTIWERFAAYLRSQDRAAITVNGYLRDLQAFARWFEQTNGEALSLERITSTDAREYRQWLIARQAAPSSVNRRLSALRAFFEWAQGQALDVRGVEEQSLAPRWLDRREQSALLREAERALSAARSEAARLLARRDHVILLTLLNTGLRISELCALNVEDLELSERKGWFVVRMGKGSRQRQVPLNNPTRKALHAWLEARPGKGSNALFTGRRGERLTPSGVGRRLTAMARRAGVEGVTLHTLRHTFAKNLVDAGVGLERVAALLGHNNLNTTRIYTLPGERDLERAVERLE